MCRRITAQGSTIDRYGLGVVQEIDAAAMHLFAKWQLQEIDLGFTGRDQNNVRRNVSQGYDTWNLFQVGGVIFF